MTATISLASYTLYASVLTYAHFSHFTCICNNHTFTLYHLAWDRIQETIYHLLHYALLHKQRNLSPLPDISPEQTNI